MKNNSLIRFYGVRGCYPDEQQMVSFSISTETSSLLFDCGSTNIFNYKDVISDLSHIFVTHHHHDHIALLPNIMLAKLLSHDSRKLQIISPESIQLLAQSMEIDETEYFHSTSPHTIAGDFIVSNTLTTHLRSNYCYKLVRDGITITYTGDTAYDSKLSQFCKDSDVMILEGSYDENSIIEAQKYGHLTPKTAASLINEARPRQAILTHFVRLAGDDFVKEVKKHLTSSTTIIAAFDGLEILI